MGKVNPNEFGGGKLVPDDLDDEVALLTVAEFHSGNFTFDGVTKKSAWLVFEETGSDKRLFMNRTQLQMMVSKYGDESDRWVGKVVPVERIIAEYEGDSFPKVSVVTDGELFDEYLTDAGYPKPGSAPKTRRTKKKATKGKTRRAK